MWMIGALVWWAGCSREREVSGAPDVASRLFGLADEARGMPGLGLPSSARMRPRFDELVTKARRAVGKRRGAEAARALGAFLFEGAGLVREVDDPDLGTVLLSGVLAGQRGSCLGLSGLYLALAERLGIEAHGVLAPGHFFVRAGGHNLELLRRAEPMPDAWYRARYRVPPEVEAYLRPLTVRETLAVFRFNLGNAARTRGHHDRAAALYRRAARDFPGFPEAQANLGLVLQRAGDLQGAERAYLRAAALWPDLPGLRTNLSALYLATGRPAEARAWVETPGPGSPGGPGSAAGGHQGQPR